MAGKLWMFLGLYLLFLCTEDAARAQLEANGLSPYAGCTFSDGLQIVATDMLPQGVTSRSVDTDGGTRSVAMESGMRLMFAYPDTDFYANVKTERIPAAHFAEMKSYLMENFDHLAHGNTIKTALHSPLNGFEAHGLDRDKVEGGVLGIYLLFDDADHTVTTIYMLNQDPQRRKFQTMDEYRALRDRFLSALTACVQSNLGRNHH